MASKPNFYFLSGEVNNGAASIPTGDGMYPLFSIGATRDPSDTLWECYLQVSLTLECYGATPPPIAVGSAAHITATIGYDAFGFTLPVPPDDDTSWNLGSWLLVPTVYSVPTDPTRFMVHWTSELPLHTKAHRTSTSGGATPTVTAGFELTDQAFAFDPAFGHTMSWHQHAVLRTLWRSIVP